MSTDKLDQMSQEIIEENIDKGQQILDIYKGKTLHGLSGESTDLQSLSRGHFGGTAAGIISVIILLQELLNSIATIRPELIPVEKHSSQGIILVDNLEEAQIQGNLYDLTIVQKGKYNKNNEFIISINEKNKYYFDYKGYIATSRKLEKFAYNVARATGSFQGETKQTMSTAVANIKPVPVFPAMQSMRPNPELYGGDKDPDAD